jgi:DNA repair protein RecN (Recombination protein N)
MLTDLQIKNLAIIESLHVSFGDGLNVLTGETGAGKSIVIDAVNLVMGGRASTDLIRSGEEEAVVEALFDLSGRPELLAALEEAGIDCDGELVVKRTVSRSGKNRVFIGGGISTLSVLADIARRLLNIYGQHESQTLLKPENHLLLLDGFAGLEPRRRQVAVLHADYRALLDRRRKLEEGEREAERRLDLLDFQSQEIGKAALAAGEEEELERERQILSHSGKLLQHATESYDILYGDEGSVLGRLRLVAGGIGEASRIDATLAPLLEAIESAYAAVEDASLSLRDYAARVEADPERLTQVDDRLDLIRRLKKKYGSSVEEILRYRDEIDAEIDLLRNSERAKGDLDLKLADLSAKLLKESEALSAARSEAAQRLGAAMERELHDLAMKEARFQVRLERLEEPREAGIDRAEFLFSPNPGEGFRPLARIASGGELSRLMLALKQVHPESDVPTLVFDEVDTGIGGATSAVVGEKLRRVSRKQQVLCITHLPQVAAFGDRHYRVEKRIISGRTSTVLSKLDGEARVEEMARMSGGTTITETTLRHAREMVEGALVKAGEA